MVSTGEGKVSVDKYRLNFLERSAQITHNVDEAFLRTAEEIHWNIKSRATNVGNESYEIKKTRMSRDFLYWLKSAKKGPPVLL